MSKETESTTFGITGVQHHLTSEKLDRIEKEIRAIDKEHKGKPFDLSRLIDSLETFIRAEFKDAVWLDGSLANSSTSKLKGTTCGPER